MILSNFTVNHFEKIESYIPFQTISFSDGLIIFTITFLVILFRYLSLVYLSFLIFWIKKIKNNFKVHDFKIKDNQISHEIKWSLVSTFIFSFFALIMAFLWKNNLTQIYLKFDQYSIWYLPVSFLIYSLMHEFYFYFTHLWMHRPGIYARVHAVHHYSRKVSPWASFSFHPYETVIQALFLPLMICIVPIHPVVAVTYLTFMTLTAISNHLGVEIMPKKYFEKWFISGAHHSIHHEKFTSNYGLYYTFLDKFFKTEYLPKN